MLYSTLEADIRSNAKLCTSNSELEVERNQTFLVISAEDTKNQSFCIKIDEIEIDASFPVEPILQVDREKIGLLSNGDRVKLYPYRISDAKEVDIIFEAEKHGYVMQGDWSGKIRSIIEDMIFDINDKVKVNLQETYQNRKVPIHIEGLMAISDPPFPIRIGPLTTIRLRKMTAPEYRKSVQYLITQKGKYAEELEVRIKQHHKKIISELKAQQDTSCSENYLFYQTSAKQMDGSIQGLFAGYELHEERMEEDNNHFSSSRTYIIRENLVPHQIVDIHLSGTQTKGSVVISVFSKNFEKSSTTTQSLLNTVKALQRGARSRSTPNLSSNTCPHCGAQKKTKKLNGVTVCVYCKNEL
ncbi:MAG: hypothetical protein ACTSWW_06435 [Promethearchaeota archaeon]